MASESRSVGFVYVLTNDAMPGLAKIGFAMSLAEDRALSLYTTGVPAPFGIAFRAATSRPRKVEQHAHGLLASVRYNQSREFFRADAEMAARAVREALVVAGGIASRQRPNSYVVGDRDRLALALGKGQVFALIGYPDTTHLLGGRAKIVDLWQAHSDGDLLEIMGTNSPGHVAGLSDGDPGSTDDPVPFLDRERSVPNGFINGRERVMPGERLVWLPAPDAPEDQGRIVFEASCECQIVSRTWTPVLGEHGLPHLLNDFLHDDVWPAAAGAVQEVLALPAPRSWAPRGGRDGWAPVATDPQSPQHWLPQLAPKRRGR